MIKDSVGLKAFGANLNKNAQDLSGKIITQKYKPQKGFKFYAPKSSGTQRTKTLLFIEDALVYQCIANIVAERAYPLLHENDDFVYGSVLIPEVEQGIEILKSSNPNFFFFKFWKSLYAQFKNSVIKAIEEDKATHKFETDITGFFDSIPHYNLLMTLSEKFNIEDEILDLLSVCLNAWSGTKDRSTPGVGIPQGPNPSFLFANILLYDLDKMVIDEAHKYYRYMDDIHIYGYSKEALIDVLVKIDNYLKGHGLSINSKKTKIERIDPNKEDNTVKQLKRFDVLTDSYDGLSFEINPDPNNSNVISTLSIDIAKNLSSLSDQTNEFLNESIPDSISSREEILAFWRKEIHEVEKELPKLFKKNSNELLKPNETDDIDFIRLSAKYGIALQALNEFEKVEGEIKLLPYWLFALKKYFWRVQNYVITLQYYRNNEDLKNNLITLYEFGKNYESYRYHIVICLNYNFKHSDRELREYFKWIKTEDSDLVKYALYMLIIKGSVDGQLNRSLKLHLSKEQSQYLKIMVLSYWKNNRNRSETMHELINSVGL